MGSLARITLPDPNRLRADLVVVGCLEGEETSLHGAPAELRDSLRSHPRLARWQAASGSALRLDGAGAGDVVVLGLGAREELDRRRIAAFCQRAVQAAQEARAKKLAIVLPRHPELRRAAGLVQIQMALSRYRFEEFRTASSPDVPRSVQLFPPAADRSAYRSRSKVAGAVAEGVALARDLGNTPPNVANPQWMAARARSVARACGAKIRVLSVAELKKKGMGGILAVAGGSASPARLARIDLGSRGPIVALVGKGVTFDTGGISIKPAAAMDEMKYDKCGACTVLGIVAALGRLQLPIRLRAYLPLAENMPSGTAYRPGDIVRCYNGKTVEILNTDAEGRMILADALAWAAEDKPDHILEYSTLTGAAVVALGERAAAIYSPSDRLADAVLRSAEGAGELLWRMPLWPEFLEDMKGNHGDLKNSGSRWGGANTAAAFLSQFVDGHESWAHIDIAGPATSNKPKGATGYGVAFTVDWLAGLVSGSGR